MRKNRKAKYDPERASRRLRMLPETYDRHADPEEVNTRLRSMSYGHTASAVVKERTGQDG